MKYPAEVRETSNTAISGRNAPGVRSPIRWRYHLQRSGVGRKRLYLYRCRLSSVKCVVRKSGHRISSRNIAQRVVRTEQAICVVLKRNVLWNRVRIRSVNTVKSSISPRTGTEPNTALRNAAQKPPTINAAASWNTPGFRRSRNVAVLSWRRLILIH